MITDLLKTNKFAPLNLQASVNLIHISSNSLKLSFKIFFLTDVINYYEERKARLFTNIYLKISSNFGSNF